MTTGMGGDFLTLSNNLAGEGEYNEGFDRNYFDQFIEYDADVPQPETDLLSKSFEDETMTNQELDELMNKVAGMSPNTLQKDLFAMPGETTTATEVNNTFVPGFAPTELLPSPPPPLTSDHTQFYQLQTIGDQSMLNPAIGRNGVIDQPSVNNVFDPVADMFWFSGQGSMDFDPKLTAYPNHETFSNPLQLVYPSYASDQVNPADLQQACPSQRTQFEQTPQYMEQPQYAEPHYVAPQPQRVYQQAEFMRRYQPAQQTQYAAPPAQMTRVRPEVQTGESSTVGQFQQPPGVLSITGPQILPPDPYQRTRPQRRRGKAANTANFTAEKPQEDEDRLWVRVNGGTQGKSKRSGKLNQYNAEDHYDPLPLLPSWQSADGNTEFRYTEYGELTEKTYTGQELSTFILEHDTVFADQHCNLRLWIQKQPADSARRYPSKQASQCRFAECPYRQVGKNAIIQAGHLRVAIDENWNVYKKKADPFLVAAVGHLFCFEQFINFPLICSQVEVKLDERVDFSTEPNREFYGALDIDDKRRGPALAFLKAIKKGTFNEKYTFHPMHYGNGSKKPYEDTLTHHMVEAELEGQRNGKTNQYAGRGSNSNITSHRGDLYKFVQLKWPEEHAKFIAPRPDETLPTPASPVYPRFKKAGNKRKHQVIEEEEEEDEADYESDEEPEEPELEPDTSGDDLDEPPPPKKRKFGNSGNSSSGRRSPRVARKKRVNYRED